VNNGIVGRGDCQDFGLILLFKNCNLKVKEMLPDAEITLDNVIPIGLDDAGGDKEMPLFLEHNLLNQDMSKVIQDFPLLLSPVLSVATYLYAALRVEMLG
jgi:hypothetical protein